MMAKSLRMMTILRVIMILTFRMMVLPHYFEAILLRMMAKSFRMVTILRGA